MQKTTQSTCKHFKGIYMLVLRHTHTLPVSNIHCGIAEGIPTRNSSTLGCRGRSSLVSEDIHHRQAGRQSPALRASVSDTITASLLLPAPSLKGSRGREAAAVLTRCTPTRIQYRVRVELNWSYLFILGALLLIYFRGDY